MNFQPARGKIQCISVSVSIPASNKRALSQAIIVEQKGNFLVPRGRQRTRRQSALTINGQPVVVCGRQLAKEGAEVTPHPARDG